jgi:hypothetical protein
LEDIINITENEIWSDSVSTNIEITNGSGKPNIIRGA